MVKTIFIVDILNIQYFAYIALVSIKDFFQKHKKTNSWMLKIHKRMHKK